MGLESVVPGIMFAGNNIIHFKNDHDEK